MSAELIGHQRTQVEKSIKDIIETAVCLDRDQALHEYCNQCPKNWKNRKGDNIHRKDTCWFWEGFCEDCESHVAIHDWEVREDAQDMVVARIMDVITLDPSPRLKTVLRGIVGTITPRKEAYEAILFEVTTPKRVKRERMVHECTCSKCPLCAVQGIESKMVARPKIKTCYLDHPVVVGLSHYECENCGYNIFPATGKKVKNYNRSPDYKNMPWTNFREKGYLEHRSVITALRFRGAHYGATNPVFASLQPTIVGADHPADVLRELIAKIMSRPKRRHNPYALLETDGCARKKTICEDCGGRLKIAKTGELFCTVCGLVDDDLLIVNEVGIEYGRYGEPGKNMPGVSEATRKFEKDHHVKGWVKKHPAERRKSKRIIRLRAIVSEHLDEFFGVWDSLGLYANRKLLRQLYAEKHGKVLDDSTLCRCVTEIKPLQPQPRPEVPSEEQEIKEIWFVHNNSPPKPQGLNELAKKIKVEEMSQPLVVHSVQ